MSSSSFLSRFSPRRARTRASLRGFHLGLEMAHRLVVLPLALFNPILVSFVRLRV